MTPFTPDEALYAFVDGELELGDEQQLFDALASHPELRTEMKDVLAIRNAVHRDVLFPPASAETEMLAAAGLVAPVGAVAVAGGSTAMSRLLHTGGGILAGVIIAYFLFNADGTSQEQRNQQALAGEGARTSATTDVTTGATPAITVPPVRVETLYVRVPVKTPTSQSPSIANVNTNANTNEPSDVAPSLQDGPRTSTSMLIGTTPPMNLGYSRTLAVGPLFRDSRLVEASPLAPSVIPLPVSLQVRSLASSLSGERQIPQSVNDAILPNSAFALLFPVDNTLRVGAEMGVEAFHQVFRSVRDGRPVEVDQTPVLYWLGGAGEWAPWEMDFLLDGLRPFVSGTIGYAFSQGPVGRASLGLQYQPAGPVRFSAGVDGAILAFADSGNWFFSKKLGFTYALSVDLGAIR